MKASLTISPWFDPRYGNIFRREMTLAAENSEYPGFQPEPTYVWLQKNAAADHLYKAGKSLFAYGPALVDGHRPADFSYEYFGEFMP